MVIRRYLWTLCFEINFVCITFVCSSIEKSFSNRNNSQYLIINKIGQKHLNFQILPNNKIYTRQSLHDIQNGNIKQNKKSVTSLQNNLLLLRFYLHSQLLPLLIVLEKDVGFNNSLYQLHVILKQENFIVRENWEDEKEHDYNSQKLHFSYFHLQYYSTQKRGSSNHSSYPKSLELTF